jgi:ribosome-associated heat shock protein Hsp15
MRGRGDAGAEAPEEQSGPDVRLDKWLWAARFYKTRSLAAEAIVAGKVQLNGERVKRAKMVQVGDELRIRNGPFEQIIHVRALSGRRGGAPDAAKLYAETPESRAGREALALQMRSIPGAHDAGRPSKKDRRIMERFRDEER